MAGHYATVLCGEKKKKRRGEGGMGGEGRSPYRCARLGLRFAKRGKKEREGVGRGVDRSFFRTSHVAASSRFVWKQWEKRRKKEKKGKKRRDTGGWRNDGFEVDRGGWIEESLKQSALCGKRRKKNGGRGS